jgi:hypothetical protein
MNTYSSAGQRTPTVPATAPRKGKRPEDLLPNAAGQTGTVTSKMKPSGIINLALRKR